MSTYQTLLDSIFKDDLNAVQKCLDEGINPNVWPNNREPALITATRCANPCKMTKMLLDAGADANVVNRYGDTVLTRTCEQKKCYQPHKWLLLESLLKWRSPDGDKFDVNLTNRKNQTALEIACRQGEIKVAQMLLDAGADFNIGYPISNALVNKHYELANLLILLPGINVNKRGVGEKSALMNASQDGKNDLVKVLLEKGADPNIVDSDGNSALTLVCKRGRNKTEIAKMLLNAGANINHVDNNGYNALVIATMCLKKRSSKIVHVLLDNGANPGQVTNDMTTALYYAVASSHKEMINLLSQYVCSIQSTFYCACALGNTHLLGQLMKIPYIDVNARNEIGLTPLMIATIRNQKAVVQMLMDDKRVEYHPTVSLSALQLSNVMYMHSTNENIKQNMYQLGREMRQKIKQRQDEDKCTLGLVMNRLNCERTKQGNTNIPGDVIQNVMALNL